MIPTLFVPLATIAEYYYKPKLLSSAEHTEDSNMMSTTLSVPLATIAEYCYN